MLARGYIAPPHRPNPLSATALPASQSSVYVPEWRNQKLATLLLLCLGVHLHFFL